MCMYSSGVRVLRGAEKACDWGTRRLSECIPKGQDEIPQESWTSDLYDARQDPWTWSPQGLGPAERQELVSEVFERQFP